MILFQMIAYLIVQGAKPVADQLGAVQGIGTVIVWAVGIFVSAGLVLITITAYKAWNFSRWMESEVHKIIASAQDSTVYRNTIVKMIHGERESESFRDAAKRAVMADYQLAGSEHVKRHNDDAASHAGFQRYADAFIRAHVAENITIHNADEVAHARATIRYATRSELQGAIDRLEERISSESTLILQRLTSVREDIARLERHGDHPPPH